MGTRVLGLIQFHEKNLEPVREIVEEEVGRQLSSLAWQRLRDYQLRKAAECTNDPSCSIALEVADFMETVPPSAPEYEILSKVLGIPNGTPQLQPSSSLSVEGSSHQVYGVGVQSVAHCSNMFCLQSQS